MKIMERKYICKNGVVERTRYAVGDNAQPRGKRKKGNTSFRKQEANYNCAVRRLARILNCNCTHTDGLLLTLTLDRKGMEQLIGTLSEEQSEIIYALTLPQGSIGDWCAGAKNKKKTGNAAEETVQNALDALKNALKHQAALWLRRIKRKHGKQIKAVTVTADMDGETGELVRAHCHIVLMAAGISWDLLQQEWKLGGVDIRRLRDQGDYTPIAVYLMRQVRRVPDEKKYQVTRNMELPQISEKEVLNNAEMKAPAGARVLEQEYSAENIGQYIRYIPRKTEYRRKATGFLKGGDTNGV